jgi:hypothetical protein
MPLSPARYGFEGTWDQEGDIFALQSGEVIVVLPPDRSPPGLTPRESGD